MKPDDHYLQNVGATRTAAVANTEPSPWRRGGLRLVAAWQVDPPIRIPIAAKLGATRPDLSTEEGQRAGRRLALAA